jgi:hypothetical protein
MTSQKLKLTCAALLLWPVLALAGVPQTVAFSARIADAGQPVTGPQNFTFTLWNDPTAVGTTALVWTESQSGVPVSDGVVVASLGDVANGGTALPAFVGTPLWLEVTMGSTTFAPRIAIQSVPYAFRAAEADLATTASTATSAASATVASQLSVANAGNSSWTWSGQGGQPSWVWGSNDGTNMYVYNPSNFSVASATNASNVNDTAGTVSTGFLGVAGNGYISGKLGIGTPQQLFPLDVSGAYAISYGGYFGFLNGMGNSGEGLTFTNRSFSMRVSNGIWSTSGEFDTASDRRMKEKIGDISAVDALRFLEEARPVHFKWKNRDEYGYGFIAQDIAKLGFKDVVVAVPNADMKKTVDEDGYVSAEGAELGLGYQQFTAILTKVTQVEHGMIKALSATTARHGDEIAVLESKATEQDLAIAWLKEENAGLRAELVRLRTASNSGPSGDDRVRRLEAENAALKARLDRIEARMPDASAARFMTSVDERSRSVLR